MFLVGINVTHGHVQGALSKKKGPAVNPHNKKASIVSPVPGFEPLSSQMEPSKQEAPSHPACSICEGGDHHLGPEVTGRLPGHAAAPQVDLVVSLAICRHGMSTSALQEIQ